MKTNKAKDLTRFSPCESGRENPPHGRSEPAQAVAEPVVDNGRNANAAARTARGVTPGARSGGVEIHEEEGRVRDLDFEEKALIERWATLGKLSAALAHEIKNPLAALRLQVENLHALLSHRPADPSASPPPSGGDGLPPRVRDTLDAIHSTLGRVLALAEEIRRYGHPQDTSPSEVDLREVVDSALVLLRPKLRDLTIRTDIDPALSPIWTHRLKIEQILINLIANAAEASAAREDHEGSEVRIGVHARDGAITVEVADTAGGIPSAVAGRIFKSHVTTKPVEEGTGLGLMVVRDTVRALGGDITFQTRPGHGTTFTVRLPKSSRPLREGVL
ncbi:MAG: sensor histidine kinase [Nitrospinota bacterium]